jgi:solute carrier family 25 (mitochondrial phosphate transporter), member 3
LRALKPRDLLPLWSGFAPTVSRELPFAIAKFLTFDEIASTLVRFVNNQAGEMGSLPIQVGVGTVGLLISAFSGAIAGIAGAFVSHPADLILTKTSATKKKAPRESELRTELEDAGPEWVVVVKDIVSQKGGFANLFVGLGARSVFFFLVIGLQFFLYDYVKNLFQVGSDDLSLVLDVFYAVRAGLAGIDTDY